MIIICYPIFIRPSPNVAISLQTPFYIKALLKTKEYTGEIKHKQFSKQVTMYYSHDDYLNYYFLFNCFKEEEKKNTRI